MQEIPIGKVERFFGKIGVAAIKVTEGELNVGDRIKVRGHSTDFEQIVDSMQVEHMHVQKAGTGDQVGIKVVQKVHENDKVYVLRE